MCRSAENQFRFEVERERCHATWQLVQKQNSSQGDDVDRQSTAWSAHLKKPEPTIT